jgi:hypothetical protein
MTKLILALQVLEPELLPYYEKLWKECGGPIMFQQDNAPSHKANATKAWFEAWFAWHDIPILNHPPDSPDVNSIKLHSPTIHSTSLTDVPEYTGLAVTSATLSLYRYWPSGYYTEHNNVYTNQWSMFQATITPALSKPGKFSLLMSCSR